MAQPTVFNGSKLYISLGDGGSPEVYTTPCGLTSRGLTLTKDTNDTPIPDCDDPDAPVWVGRSVTTLSGEATGSGVLAAEALPVWQDAFNSTVAVSARIGINAPPANNGGYYQGMMHLTSFGLTGDLGEKVQVAVTLQSDGILTWVPAA
jgi:Phage tail tube protein